MKTIPDKAKLGKKFCGQAEYELDWLIRVLQRENVKSILEVGSRYGNVLGRMAEEVGVETAVGIDMPNGPWGRMNSKKELERNIRDLQLSGINAHMIIGNSRDLNVIREAMKHGPYDFVFIDGDHRYEGVKADWENYGRYARICGFHDIEGAGKFNRDKEEVEVPRFWEEVKGLGHHEQCVEPGRQLGIGLVWNGDQ